MRKKLRKRLSVILVMLFIALIQLQPLQANALAVSNELKVSSALTQWVLDEPTNTLYAISETGKNLLFINSTTMSIEKSIALNGGPTDIIKDNGKLYIALASINQIVIVDMDSRTITGSIYTSSDPYRIEKDGDKIYYTERNYNLYEYNLITNEDQTISVGSSYKSDIAINSKDHILYIGGSGTSGSNMTYYSTTDNKVIGKTNLKTVRGFPYPDRYTIYDGTNVYYAGRDFKPDDPTRYNGDFGSMENVIYVNRGLVYTNKSIYNKETHIKLGDYGINADLVEASNNTLYIYNKDNGIIKRFNDYSNPIDSNNIISLISGKHAAIQNTAQSIQINSGMSTLEMKSKLIQWTLDESTNTLYGISTDDKSLFFVNTQTLNLEKSLTFKSSPTDIIKDGGKLYIALDDLNQIAIVDMASRAIVGTLYTSSDPYRIEKDGNKIYYTERDQWCYIYEYDLTTNKDQKTSVDRVYQPDLAINLDDHILYIGESGSSASNMIYYSTIGNKVIGKTNYNGYGFPYPGRYTIFDGEKVYFAGFDFNKQDPTRILGSYGDKKDIIFAKSGFVFTNTKKYDRESRSLIVDYKYNINLNEVSNQAEMYYYRESENSIIKIDPTEISLVQFDSRGGSEVELILVGNNTLIKAPTEPTKEGYIFGGWYKEASYVNQWNFATDKVTSDTTLYAKWTFVISAPALIKAESSSLNSINVSWEPVTGASGYEIYKFIPSTGSYSLVTTTTATSYNDTALVTGTSYGYKVRAYKMVGTTKVYSSYSSIVGAEPTPAIPTLLQAESSSYNSVNVSWGAIDEASGYELYRSTSMVGPFNLVATTTSTSHNDTALETGTMYYYRVRAYTMVGTTKVYSRDSANVSAEPLLAAPAPLKAVSSSYDSINVSWDKVSGASGYELYKSTSSTGPYSLVTTTTATSYNNTALSTNNTYYYKVRAYRMVGTTKVYSSYSTIVSAKPIPTTPATVKAVSSSYNSINVSWGAVTGASGYEVYRATSSTGPYTIISTITATSCNSIELTTNSTYYYKVRAYKMVGTAKVYSDFSEVVNGKPIPATPASAKAVSSSYNSINVSWGAVTGASGYEVYRATSSTGPYTIISTTTATSCNSIGLTTNSTYYYKVRAYRLVGTTKVYSNFTSVLSAKPVPSVPSSLKAVRYSSTSINLTWNGVSGASGYEIYRATSSTGTYSLLKTTTDKYYKNTGLTTGKTYYYKIKAYRTVGTTKVYSNWTTVAYAKP